MRAWTEQEQGHTSPSAMALRVALVVVCASASAACVAAVWRRRRRGERPDEVLPGEPLLGEAPPGAVHRRAEPPLPSRCTLGARDTERYGRQAVLAGFGAEGQARVLHASVLVVGCGGLGSPVVELLAGAGVGRLGLVDPDVVEVSNLHRQTIHSEAEAGRSKAASAARFVARLNAQVRVEQHAVALDAANCLALVQQYDLVVEATDSLAAKYLCSDACVAARKPLIAGAAQGWEGQAALFLPGQRCYRCVFPVPLPAAERATCADNGVLGPVCHIVGSLQALLALQFIADPARAASDALLVADLAPGQLGPTVRAVKLPARRPSCPCASSAAAAAAPQARAPAPAPAPAHDALAAPAVAAAQRAVIRASAAFCEEHQLLAPACPRNRLRVPPHNNCSWDEALQLRAAHGASGCRIVDVREPVQFGIWALADAVNKPLRTLRDASQRRALLAELFEPRGQSTDEPGHTPEPGPVRVLLLVCRRGEHSQDATLLFSQELATHQGSTLRILNVQGGLEALARAFPGAYPIY